MTQQQAKVACHTKMSYRMQSRVVALAVYTHTCNTASLFSIPQHGDKNIIRCLPFLLGLNFLFNLSLRLLPLCSSWTAGLGVCTGVGPVMTACLFCLLGVVCPFTFSFISFIPLFIFCRPFLMPDPCFSSLGSVGAAASCSGDRVLHEG